MEVTPSLRLGTSGDVGSGMRQRRGKLGVRRIHHWSGALGPVSRATRSSYSSRFQTLALLSPSLDHNQMHACTHTFVQHHKRNESPALITRSPSEVTLEGDLAFVHHRVTALFSVSVCLL